MINNKKNKIIILFVVITVIIGIIFIINKTNDNIIVNILHESNNETNETKEYNNKKISGNITIYYVNNNGEIKECEKYLNTTNKNEYKDFFYIIKEVYQNSDVVKIPNSAEIQSSIIKTETLYLNFNKAFKNIEFDSSVICNNFVKSLVKTLISSQQINNDQYEDVQFLINNEISNIFGDEISTDNPLRY